MALLKELETGLSGKSGATETDYIATAWNYFEI